MRLSWAGVHSPRGRGGGGGESMSEDILEGHVYSEQYSIF